ncbi:unnamed protein product, partial [Meganyctiphanes norvegica]
MLITASIIFMFSWCLAGTRPRDKSSVPILFILSTAVLCLSGQVPQTTAHLSSLSDYNNSVDIDKREVTLVEGGQANVTVNFIGNFSKDIILMFKIRGDDVLAPIDNITEKAGSLNGSSEVTITSVNVGHAVMFVNTTPSNINMTDLSKAFIRVSVYHTATLDYISDIVGWMYLVAWSVSFYPQTYSNWKRKSVIGLHFDFLTLNIIGFFVYSMFNICLYAIPDIEKQYFQRHPFGINPVQLNDVIFSVHAFFACAVQVVQCLVYERGDQQVSKTARWIISAISVSTIIAVILGVSKAVQWLDFLYFISYIKLFITLIKYIPQTFYNYRRSSGTRWAVCSFAVGVDGGSVQLGQMLILVGTRQYHEWSLMLDSPGKGFGLIHMILALSSMLVWMFRRVLLGFGPDLSFETCMISNTGKNPKGANDKKLYFTVHRV